VCVYACVCIHATTGELPMSMVCACVCAYVCAGNLGVGLLSFALWTETCIPEKIVLGDWFIITVIIYFLQPSVGGY